MKEFTHLDLLEITEKEQELKMLLSEEEKEFSPKQSTVNFILDYSKALSIRKSKSIDYIEMLLN
ncbi:MAG: hypothetical protein J5I47_08830 [Vicingus serpentipes]|nr:hypothetical protein [Vicingus serpentipes]